MSLTTQPLRSLDKYIFNTGIDTVENVRGESMTNEIYVRKVNRGIPVHLFALTLRDISHPIIHNKYVERSTLYVTDGLSVILSEKTEDNDTILSKPKTVCERCVPSTALRAKHALHGSITRLNQH